MDVLKEDGKGDLHRIKSTLTLEYETAEMAKDILKSIEIDNYSFVKCKLEGKKIICEAESDKPSSLLHTLDDLLACVITAESVYHSI